MERLSYHPYWFLLGAVVLGVALSFVILGWGEAEVANVQVAQAQVTSASVSQYGITWTFDRAYPAGQFANGDWWVVGPVKITRITPDYDGTKHGWEVNPISRRGQGFDARADEWSSSLVPSLPFTAQSGQSIVKAYSDVTCGDGTFGEPCLKTAAVLTVVGNIPPNGGQSVFRPPYSGSDKTYYSINNLRTDLLPSYPKVTNTPSLDWVVQRFGRMQLEHLGSLAGRELRPVENMMLYDHGGYGPNIASDNGEGALRLMLDDPVSAKTPALIAFVQYGIDLYGAVRNGQVWPGGGGHDPGYKMPLTFAAALLNHPGMKDAVRNNNFWSEDEGVQRGVNGRALYGFRSGVNEGEIDEARYWDGFFDEVNSNSFADPYGYVDAGPSANGYQFCCLSQPWKAAALSVRLMPAMLAIWGNAEGWELLDYADRWVTHGTWTVPDPCARKDPGPNYNGACIPGSGRYPELHGMYKDGGYFGSDFVNSIWNAYRDAASSGGGNGGKTHYVDNTASGANDGTSWANAWKSFAAINWSAVKPGNTIYISGGSSSKTYTETLTISGSGAAGSPIAIRTGQDAGHNGTVIIDGQFSRTNNIVLTSGAGYITIDGSVNGAIRLRIERAKDDGIVDGSANHIELGYLEIANNGKDIQDDGYYVDLGSAAGGNKIHHSKIHDNFGDQIGGYIGASATGFDRYEIYENEIYNLHDDGIEMNIGGLLIHDNRIHTLTRGVDEGHADAIQIEGAEYLKIYNNVIYNLSRDMSNDNCYDCGSNALLYVNPVGNAQNRQAHHVYIYNNLLYETYPPISGVYVRGISFKMESNMESASDIYILNNTIVDVPFWGTSLTFNRSSNVKNVFVENNIYFNTAQIGDRNLFYIGRAGGGGFTFGSHGEGKDVTIDYNLIHTGARGSNDVALFETDYSYDQFKTTTGAQKHEVITAPTFVSYTTNSAQNDFHLSAQDTSARDRGIAQSLFQTDREGTPRPQGIAWDIGADEFGAGTTVPTCGLNGCEIGETPLSCPQDCGTKKPTVTPSLTPGIQGDLDRDEDVDIFDYNIMIENFGNTTCGNVADVDGNCKVDIFDYNILIENFGRGR